MQEVMQCICNSHCSNFLVRDVCLCHDKHEFIMIKRIEIGRNTCAHLEYPLYK